MQPISSLISGAAQPPAAAADVKGPSEEKRPEEKESQERARKPEMDEYVPEAKGPEKKIAGSKAESCTVNTDKADREIEKLKKKKEELERQIRSETDEEKAKALEKELAQAERELRQKDNDAYRRQHAVYTYA